MGKVLAVLLIIAVIAGGTVGILFATGVIGGNGSEDSADTACEGGHTWEVDKKEEATCYSEGSQTLVCKVCAETRTQVLPKTAHRMAMIAAKDPTCTKPGNTAGEMCIEPGCGYMTGNELIPTSGHNWVDTPAKAATCTETGYGEGGKHCSVCAEINPDYPVEVIPTIGHNYVASTRVEPTCAAPGSIGGEICTMCQRMGPAPYEEIPMLEGGESGPHSAEFVIDTRATCTEDGYMKCPDCGYREVFEYKNNSLHVYEVCEEKIAPDCKNKIDGKSAVVCCSNPGCEVKLGGSVIPWESCHYDSNLTWTVIKDVDNENNIAGIKTATCPTCGEVITRDILPSSGIFDEDYDIFDKDAIKSKRKNDEDNAA